MNLKCIARPRAAPNWSWQRSWSSGSPPRICRTSKPQRKATSGTSSRVAEAWRPYKGSGQDGPFYASIAPHLVGSCNPVVVQGPATRFITELHRLALHPANGEDHDEE